MNKFDLPQSVAEHERMVAFAQYQREVIAQVLEGALAARNVAPESFPDIVRSLRIALPRPPGE